MQGCHTLMINQEFWNFLKISERLRTAQDNSKYLEFNFQTQTDSG